MEKLPWFSRWFGETYKQLYPHRDNREAESQVATLQRNLPVTSAWRILDVGCGQGRQLEILRRRGFRAAGVDLSAELLRDAAEKKLAVVRGDMRRLPFRSAGFDLVTSFFTSFGYFATFDEDVEALAQFASALKPGGYLFLDLPNKGHLLNTLVPFDNLTVAGAAVELRRRVEGSVVIKEITIRRGGAPERFEERVRLFGLEELAEPALRLGLAHTAVFGDEGGGPWHPEHSPRMSLLFRKSG
jgi:SAM-dependent methyltransferase